jgi:hypothetical protein
MAPRTSLSHCLSLLSKVVPDDEATLVKDLPVERILQALCANRLGLYKAAQVAR